MTRPSVHRPFYGSALVAAAVMACVAGCAGTDSLDLRPEGPGSVSTPAGQALTPQAAMALVAPGSSSKADVRAALGTRAIVIPFDSGYEVWVYRWPGPDKTSRSATELVLLFEPSGLASKVRLRPGYAAQQ